MSARMSSTLAPLGVLVIAGCAASPVGSEAGFGLPTLSADDAGRTADDAGEPFLYREGTLDLAENGCFHWSSSDDVDGAWIVWPEGYAQDDDEVIAPGGRRLVAGDPIAGSTVLLDLAALPDGAQEDSYFGSFGGFCGAGEAGVVVIATFEG